MIRALEFLGKRRFGFVEMIGPIGAVLLARGGFWWSAAGALLLGFILMLICWAVMGDLDLDRSDEE